MSRLLQSYKSFSKSESMVDSIYLINAVFFDACSFKPEIFRFWLSEKRRRRRERRRAFSQRQNGKDQGVLRLKERRSERVVFAPALRCKPSK